MKVTLMKPLGVKLTEVDLRDENDREQISPLLFKHGIVLFPAGCAAPGAPAVHDVDSLATLASLIGSPETQHEVKKHVKPGSPVHVLETNSPGADGVKPDSYMFHSDSSWKVDPSIATVLSCVKPSRTGGRTSFFDTQAVLHRLSPASRRLLDTHRIVHSLHYGYAEVGSGKLIKGMSDVRTAHAGIVKHPRTGRPVVYANEIYCPAIAGMEAEDAKPALQGLWADMYDDIDAYAYTHSWSAGDTVICDNFGTQHKASNDYTDHRIMYRVTVHDRDLRTEKYTFPNKE